MENQKEETENKLYRVFDEMAMDIILLTNDLKEANGAAYNHQCVLIDNITGSVIKDYSCDY